MLTTGCPLPERGQSLRRSIKNACGADHHEDEQLTATYVPHFSGPCAIDPHFGWLTVGILQQGDAVSDF